MFGEYSLKSHKMIFNIIVFPRFFIIYVIHLKKNSGIKNKNDKYIGLYIYIYIKTPYSERQCNITFQLFEYSICLNLF